MVDEIYDRIHRESRRDLNAGLDRAFARLGRAIRNAFEVGHRVHYDAPWASKGKRVRWN